eukprot:3498579-Pleurochrysis_carterae.AAC.1
MLLIKAARPHAHAHAAIRCPAHLSALQRTDARRVGRTRTIWRVHARAHKLARVLARRRDFAIARALPSNPARGA